MTRRLPARDLALVATFAALIAVLGVPGSISPFGSAVPITLQTFGVMLAGVVLGWKRGALAVVVLIVLVAAGLPLLAGGRGGLGVFAGPTVGYLLGWVPGALVVGRLAEHRPARWPARWASGWLFAASAVGGIGVVYAIGIPVQAAVLGTSGVVSTAVSALVFLPGDLLKAVLAAVVGDAVRRGFPLLDGVARR